jgi:hypothetical protein
MSFVIEGDYFEACNCSITCRCFFGTKGDGTACDAFFAWHINRGRKDAVDLTGLNVALARHRPEDPDRDPWRVELYVDERARSEQLQALEQVYGGKAGGHFAMYAKRIGAITGVHKAPIVFEKEGKKRRLRVGQLLEVDAQELTGMDGKRPSVIDNPPSWALVPQAVRQAQAERISYRDVWRFEAAGPTALSPSFGTRDSPASSIARAVSRREQPQGIRSAVVASRQSAGEASVVVSLGW